MHNLFSIPVRAVMALSAEGALIVTRSILRAEGAYAKLSPACLTISDHLTVADGAIDAEINVPSNAIVPADCIFGPGLTGFQLKSGSTFKPWTASAIKAELLDSRGNLSSEVERLCRRGGRYILICAGHDLTPKQRNDAHEHIVSTLADKGFEGHESLVEVLGAAQVAQFAERYPGTATLLIPDRIQEAWILEDWERDVHMSNPFEPAPQQAEMMARIQGDLRGTVNHVRVLGEPGVGKTRMVLEAVKTPDLAPCVLYVQHGMQFGRTQLFRSLLKSDYEKPLVLVIDELPEAELIEIWRHLKPRCGLLKVVSMDHGADETSDEDIDRIEAPRLPDESIGKILAARVGESHDLDRWIAICEGSPRVAQAIADNLRANPDDLLKPPSTVPLWERFIHSYGDRNTAFARQIDCVTQHLALFSRFGYEEPVGQEAVYISTLINRADPTIGWGRFQEIVQSLRARRVLQGSRTLFFVPKALHIHLWKRFWTSYGRGFDFTQIFSEMPESLHTWFLSMFKYASNTTAAHVIEVVLSPEGIFSRRSTLTSSKGMRFLSSLAEANPGSVLRLLESTVGAWTDLELEQFKEHRQSLVWTLGKIGVWRALAVRAMRLLAKFAVNEVSNASNNATGTLVGLFCIGPGYAATEASPQARLSVLIDLLRSPKDDDRRLGLKMASAAVGREMGFRIIGPEHQGVRQTAKLWMPTTYGEWWNAKLLYFQALFDETKVWPTAMRADVCEALLAAVSGQIKIPSCTGLAFEVLDVLLNDPAMSPARLTEFFRRWQEYENDDRNSEIAKRLRKLERQYTTQSLRRRFERYVANVDWLEWDEDFRRQHNKPLNRAKALARGLAGRVVKNPASITQLKDLFAPARGSPALWYFGAETARRDTERTLLPTLIKIALETRHNVCVHAYMSTMRSCDPACYYGAVADLFHQQDSAWLGASIVLGSDYDDEMFERCLTLAEQGWIHPSQFGLLTFGRRIEGVPSGRLRRLLRLLYEHVEIEPLFLLVELLDSIPFDDSAPFDSEFVFEVVARAIPKEENRNVMSSHYWNNVCTKLIKWDRNRALPLLNVLLDHMGEEYRLSYDRDVVVLANVLVSIDPTGAWNVIRSHFERALPEWRTDLFSWLKGGLTGFDEAVPKAAITDLPAKHILDWIEQDPESRAALVAHMAPKTLDDDHGGFLTKELLAKYGQFDGVRDGISATFHSGGWSGPTSAYLKRNREKFRHWLAAGFGPDVVNWIEEEIDYLDKRIDAEEIDEERSRFD